MGRATNTFTASTAATEGLARATESVAKVGALGMVTRGLPRALAMACVSSAEECLRMLALNLFISWTEVCVAASAVAVDLRGCRDVHLGVLGMVRGFVECTVP